MRKYTTLYLHLQISIFNFAIKGSFYIHHKISFILFSDTLVFCFVSIGNMSEGICYTSCSYLPFMSLLSAGAVANSGPTAKITFHFLNDLYRFIS